MYSIPVLEEDARPPPTRFFFFFPTCYRIENIKSQSRDDDFKALLILFFYVRLLLRKEFNAMQI